ncbi:MAG: ribonuclease P protein component [Clostridia bacterium]|nr:ribonuclease P protein component [Clostridia bacterium]
MLAKRYRLTKHGSFNYVYRKGNAVKSGVVSLIFVRGGKSVKFGFSVPNKVGKATVRNKVKRRMRAVIQERRDKVKGGVQAVFSVKNGASEMTYSQLEETMEKLLSKAGLL